MKKIYFIFKIVVVCMFVMMNLVSYSQTYCTPNMNTNGNIYYLDSLRTSGADVNIHLNNHPNPGTRINATGYSDNTSMVIEAFTGTTFNLDIYGRNLYTYFWNVFIDWNNNGSFADAGDLVYVFNTGTRIRAANTTINVPANAILGNHRMRVMMVRIGTTTDPCVNSTSIYGYTHDFILNIKNQFCTGMPTAGTVSINRKNLTCGDTTKISLLGSSQGNGVTYQWQSSLDKTNWSNESNNASFVLSTNESKTIYYRAIVSCLNSNMQATTNVDSVTISNPNFSLGNDTLLCINDTILLKPNLTTIQSIRWSDNSTSNTYKVFNPGKYFAAVLYNNGCVSSDTIAIRAGELPLSTLDSNYNLCEDSIVIVDAGNTGISYLWNNGASTSRITVTTSGVYNVAIKSRDNCISNFSTNVVGRPKPISNLISDTLICSSANLQLDGTATNANTYLWNTGSNQPVLDVVDSGTYTLELRSNYGCFNSYQTKVMYMPNPYIEGFAFIPQLYSNLKEVKFALINPQYIDSYLWDFGDGNTSTDEFPIHQFNTFGPYTVKVALENSCNTITYKQVISLNPNDIEDLSPENFSIYPIPASSNIYVNYNGSDKIIKANILDNLGRLFNATIEKGNTIDLNEYSNGIYYLVLEIENLGQRKIKFEVLK